MFTNISSSQFHKVFHKVSQSFWEIYIFNKISFVLGIKGFRVSESRIIITHRQVLEVLGPHFSPSFRISRLTRLIIARALNTYHIVAEYARRSKHDIQPEKTLQKGCRKWPFRKFHNFWQPPSLPPSPTSSPSLFSLIRRTSKRRKQAA